MRPIALFALLLVNLAAFAQPNAGTVWSAEVGQAKWMHLAPDGTVIVCTTVEKDSTQTSELFGYDPANGKVKWHLRPHPNKLISGVDPVPNLPYLRLRDVPLTIIDPHDGHVVINAATQGVHSIYNYGFLYQSGHLWLDAVYGGGRSLSLFALATGKMLWTSRSFFDGPDQSKMNSFNKIVAVTQYQSDKPRLLGAPINHGTDKMIFAVGDALKYNYLFKVHTSTGDIEWKTDVPSPNKDKLVRVEVDTSFWRMIPGPRRFFFVRANWLTACDYNTGKEMWKTPVKTIGRVGEIIYDSRGMILSSVSTDVETIISTGRFHMVNEETGAELWPSPLKYNGGLSTFQFTEKGLAVATENPESGIRKVNFIDVEKGKYSLDNALSIAGQIKHLQVVPKGVYYSSDREVNILDAEGGQLLTIPKHNRAQGPLPIAEGDRKAYVFNKETKDVYEIDKELGTARTLNKDKIDFKGNDSPDRVELRNEGVLLYSENNLTFINFDGTTRYQVHFKAVWNVQEKLKVLAALIEAVMDVAQELTAMSMTMQTQLSDPNLTVAQKADIRNTADRQMRAYVQVSGGDVVRNLDAFNAVKLRAAGSASSPNTVVILTTVDKKNVLAIVNKDTGAATSKIELVDNDDSPMYEIDPFTGRLFYIGKGLNFMKAYDVGRK